MVHTKQHSFFQYGNCAVTTATLLESNLQEYWHHMGKKCFAICLLTLCVAPNCVQFYFALLYSIFLKSNLVSKLHGNDAFMTA